jgi:hypothetical protein
MEPTDTPLAPASSIPWYRTTRRWGMTNLSEKDIADYDIGFWVQQWRTTHVQGVIANGVAKFATFPSADPLIPSSRFAPDRDLLGEIADATHRQGLVLCVRMDSNVVPEPVLERYEDWRVHAPDGRLLAQMCVNSPYRQRFVFRMYQEVIDRYAPKGFTDNAGIGVGALCHCEYCRRRWADEVGGALPSESNMDDPAFRTWARWNESIVMANWDDTQRFLAEAGGADCMFLGLARKFSPLNRTLAKRVELMMVDCQSRNDAGSFPEHVDEGRYLRGVLGSDKNVAVASSMTHHSHGYFRLTSDPTPEARMYMLSGIAGGLDLWWHHPTGYSSDRRSYTLAASISAWYEQNIDAFTAREPVAQVALLRSDRADKYFDRESFHFYQPDQLGEVTQAAYRGAAHLLFDARVPFVPVNIDDLRESGRPEPVLFLPNLGGLADEECESIRAFVQAGGGLIATGHTSLFDEDGEPRAEFALADVFGARLAQPVGTRRDLIDAVSAARLATRGSTAAPGVTADVSRYGGGAVAVHVDPARSVVASLSPGDEPAVILGEYGAGRVAYLPVDLDRRYLRSPEPAHAVLIGQIADWCAGVPRPLSWESEGRVGAYLYSQQEGHILHLLNFSGENGESMMDAFVPSGAVTVRVRGLEPGQVRARSRVRDDERVLTVVDGAVSWTVESFDEHDLWDLRPLATAADR